MSAAVSGDRRLPFRWRHGGSGRDAVGYPGPGSSSKITTRSSDPVVIDDGQQLEQQKHVEPSASATPADQEACLKRRPSPVEAQDATPDDLLQLSLSPCSVLAKKRKTISSSSMDATSCEFSISLSLSPPAAAVSMQQQQQQPEEKTRRSSDSNGGGEGVLGQSTLDLTMSIRALE